MKILVVEDKEAHCTSATETLAGHEVTIIRNFTEAMELMKIQIDENNVKSLLAENGFTEQPKIPGKDAGDEEMRVWERYCAVLKEARAASIIPFPFEAVLTDMMMPMSQRALGPGIFNPDEQVPYGFIIALKAAECGAKFVAMITDTNHHKGAMSAALDYLGSPGYYSRPNFTINGATTMFVHAPFTDNGAKDWGRVLQDLTA